MRATSTRRFVGSLFLLTAVIISSCSSSDEFTKRHCVFRDTPRVSADRVVTLFSVNYVYASSSDSDSERDSYWSNAETHITAFYKVANNIFRKNGVNIQIVPLSMQRKVDDELDLITHPLDFFDNPDPQEIVEMQRIHSGLGDFVGVHWGEWNNWRYPNGAIGWGKRPCGDERCNWVLMAGAFHNQFPDSSLGTVLAHEFGHYLNLLHVNDQANLMYPDESGSGELGTALTDSQREAMRDAVNNLRPSLLAETCDLPDTPAPKMPPTPVALVSH